MLLDYEVKKMKADSGVRIKKVADGKIITQEVPTKGSLEHLFQEPINRLLDDSLEAEIIKTLRQQNPA